MVESSSDWSENISRMICSAGDMGDNQVRLLFLQIQVGHELIHVCMLTSKYSKVFLASNEYILYVFKNWEGDL